jgi:hypothetical protein
MTLAGVDQICCLPHGHPDDGQRFIVRADEKLTAFLELESAIESVALLMSVFR